MNQITIEINGKRQTHVAPESWNDLSTQQLLHAYQIINAKVPGDPTDHVTLQEVGAKKTALLAPLFGINLPILINYRNSLISEDQKTGAETYLHALRTLISFTDPLFLEIEDKKEKRNVTINPALTRNPWPQLKHHSSQKKYFGPRDNFENLTLYELGQIFTLYQNYCDKPDDTTMNTLIATIYRPPKPATPENKEKAYEGDIRLPLSGYEATIQHRAKEIALLPRMVRKVIIFYVQSCLYQISQKWNDLFVKSTDEDGNPITPKRKGDFGKLIIKIAGGLADIDKISNQPYENAFIYLDMLEEERKERELQMLQNRRKRK